MTLEALTDSDEDTLWWGSVIEVNGDEWEEHGQTLLWGNRSLAKEAGFYYALANHVEGVRITTYPYSGERKQVGEMDCYGGDRTEPIYIGYDKDGNIMEHDANCLQYKDHLSVTFREVDSSE